MSENVSPVTLDELTEQIREIALQVSAAQERVEERDFVAATHEAVERVSQRYRDFYASLSEGDKLKVERSLGRRLLDVKRLASLLPRVGNVGSTPDRQVRGASEVGERRITGVSWGAGSRLAAAGSGARYKVGGDIEAWCSPCGGLTEHSIVAMVGDEPKQVVCQSCNGRHGYRTAPARKTSTQRHRCPRCTTTGGGGQSQRREDQKAAELRALAARARPGHRGAHLRPQAALPARRRHLPPRVRPGQGRDRPALQPARPLQHRRPEVADAELGGERPSGPLQRVDLLEEALEQALDHQVAAGGVVAAGAVAALDLVELGAGLGDQRPAGVQLGGDLLLVLDQVGDRRRRPPPR